MSTDALISTHFGATWTVAFGGFAPGFPYLVADAPHEASGPPWEVPRRAEPRTSVPAGAVGLASRYCGIYPRPSPGGWQLIGRSAAELFDPHREPPALLNPGTRVRFAPQRATARIPAPGPRPGRARGRRPARPARTAPLRLPGRLCGPCSARGGLPRAADPPPGCGPAGSRRDRGQHVRSLRPGRAGAGEPRRRQSRARRGARGAERTADAAGAGPHRRRRRRSPRPARGAPPGRGRGGAGALGRWDARPPGGPGPRGPADAGPGDARSAARARRARRTARRGRRGARSAQPRHPLGAGARPARAGRRAAGRGRARPGRDPGPRGRRPGGDGGRGGARGGRRSRCRLFPDRATRCWARRPSTRCTPPRGRSARTPTGWGCGWRARRCRSRPASARCRANRWCPARSRSRPRGCPSCSGPTIPPPAAIR